MKDKNSDEIVVYQANPLIERKNDLNLLETKFFLYCLTTLNPQLPNSKYYDKKFMKTNIPLNKIIQVFGGNNWYYNELRSVALQMGSRSIIIEQSGKEKFRVLPIFGEISFDKETGLTFEFHDKMYPFLLDLANRSYTRLDFEQLWKLNSVYAIRLLELLLQYRKIRMRTISIKDLREWLGIPQDAYKDRIDNFKRRVIELPVKEINEKTRFTVAYEYQKTGRQITAVCFIIAEPEQEKDKDAELDAEIEELLKFEAIDIMKKCGIDEAMINTLLKKYGAERCGENSRYILFNYREKAKNLAGYVVEAIKKDYWTDYRKQVDKLLIQTMPAKTPEQIEELKQRAGDGDPRAKRRLELLDIVKIDNKFIK